MCDDDPIAEAPAQADGRRTDSQHYWRCPHCGQIVFGDPSPFVCQNCHDAVTWELWEPDGQHQ